MNEQHVNLDVSKSQGQTQVVRIGQGDKAGTTIVAHVYDNGTELDMTGMTARFEYRLPYSAGYVQDEHVTVSGSTLTYVVDEEHCAAVAGVTEEAYFSIMQGSNVIASTSRFSVRVLRAASKDADPAGMYTDDVAAATRAAREAADAATEAIEQIGTAVDDAQQAAENAAQAVTDAQTAIRDADAAKQSATTAASQATAAANNANSKANEANTAANNANAATSAANDATTRANAAIDAMGDISEQAVPVMSADVRGGAKIQPNSGLEITDTDNLQVRLALESEGDVRGGLAQVTAKGHAEQDGTPTPDNPVPIQVVRGRNLLNPALFAQSIYRANADGSITVLSNDVRAWDNIQPVATLKSGKYTITRSNASGTFEVRDSNGATKTWVDSGTLSATFEITQETAIRLKLGVGASSYPFTTKIQLELGSTPTPYVPYGHVGMEVRDLDTDDLISCTAIPLPQRGWVGSLPDGTADVLTLDGAGKVTWEKKTNETTQAVTDGVSATVGVDAMSSTGQIADGATVLYKLATPVTEDCGYCEDWPTDIPEGAVVSCPELDAVGVKYFIDSGVTELARQWYAKSRSEYEDRLTSLEDTVAQLIAEG